MGDRVGAGSGAAGAWAVAMAAEAAAPAAPPAGAGAVAAGDALPGAARAHRGRQRPWNRLSARLALAAALLLLGCAAAGLAFFAIVLPPTGNKACVPTDDELARLRTASENLLLAASAQVVAATMALVVPARPVAFFGCLLGWLTAFHAYDVLGLLVTCQGRSAHADLHLCLFLVVLCAAILAGGVVSLR